jgi:V/A-type H+/Na+-transporting ATPase subunit D
MAEITATKSAALALADERALMRQGHRFLDEQRMLLAAELLRALDRHRAAEAQLLEQLGRAQPALRQALQRHGLEGLQAYPPNAAVPQPPGVTRSLFLGVPLLATIDGAAAMDVDDRAIDASPEARACGSAFAALLAPLARMAAICGNLERLGAKYRRTERRARALENVLLPEIEAALKAINEHLELADQEEAVRTRRAGAGQT